MLRPYLHRNQQSWDKISKEYQERHVSQLPTDDPTWGVWGISESQLNVLELDGIKGKDVLEFGCGGAQWSIALSRRGARVTGIDLSAAQLEFARQLVDRSGADVRLIHCNAEEVPLPDASFDIVFCDHGAMTFADPYRTVPEAARLLRRGGLFAWNAATPLLYTCCDEKDDLTEQLHKDYFALHELPEPEGGVSFQLPYSAWVRLFRQNSFSIEDLIELQPPPDAQTTYVGYAPLPWARRWPAEQIWRLRKQ
jgi:ubiquinone/menaquinone biosynthesis C-methylase UbiE